MCRLRSRHDEQVRSVA
ncbi:hypothetical protein DNX69_13185 [Rhodopseudomonas palustris]|uniref:Uncharacterized protein n=1 Tax=Rhodopseudomonas palustris TaxID=1076 RepID=A0A323UH32_RHOPL|nr:hypothetical protein DNX69_13185 [Rhodopseudomonas palustris]